VIYCDRCGEQIDPDAVVRLEEVELCIDCVAAIAERNGVEVDDLIEGEV
jgi:RNA polymerase-binding transcription factor DksA